MVQTTRSPERVSGGMLTYADVCGRMRTYAALACLEERRRERDRYKRDRNRDWKCDADSARDRNRDRVRDRDTVLML